ncbi:protein FAM227B-like isoform X1 [Littorina saxatilis]|uniref:Protein FAM227B n=1 Tax=Littorina saxatilis TaxID=31220 RepID=A0AAN9GQW6_9CAEN
MLMGKVDGGDSQGTTPSQADHKLPTTLEQFLEAEKLTDWPYPIALEGPFDINAEGLLLGTQDDIADILRESAPLGLGLLDDLEDRLAKVEEKLNSYAVHIITDDKRPSRLVERLFHSPTRSFITDASTSDVVKSHHSSRGHKSVDFADAMMETKKRSMDYCMFPGFRHGELVELPAQLEAPPLLHKITNIQNFNPGFRKFWKKLFLSEASAAVMQDTFWWIFLSQFNKERGFEEEKNQLFDRIADSYVALFASINADVKDKFLTVYPECLAQALYSAYVTAFPESRWRFDDQFKQYLINLTNEWIKGLKPVPGTWRHWDTASLEADGTGAANEANAATKKMMEAAALNKKMDVSLDMDSFHKMVARLGEEVVTPQLESREVSKLTTTGAGLTSLSRLGNAAAAGAPKKAAKESHQIGPGPEYERVKFNTQGRSPLISHYLHMRQLRDYRQPGKKVRRTEIAKLPYPFQLCLSSFFTAL